MLLCFKIPLKTKYKWILGLQSFQSFFPFLFLVPTALLQLNVQNFLDAQVGVKEKCILASPCQIYSFSYSNERSFEYTLNVNVHFYFLFVFCGETELHNLF